VGLMGQSLTRRLCVRNKNAQDSMVATRDRHRSTSFALSPEQIAWLDRRRSRGRLSRSAALRQAIDDLIAIEAQQALAAQPEAGANA
jgi:uncharacterized protein YecT (DUF1311 family)